MKLYELKEYYYEALTNSVDLESGEIYDGKLFELLAEIQEAIETKLLNVACLIKATDYEIENFEEEIKKLKRWKEIKENLSENLRNFISSNLEKGKKIEDARAKISWRKSENVKIEDDFIPAKYFTEKIIRTIDKNLIKEDLKKGIDIKNCSIETKQNLQIK